MSTWQTQFRNAVTDPAILLKTLDLSPPAATDFHPDFALRVPPTYLQAIRRNAPDDPLLRQVLPLTVENLDSPGFCADPTADLAARKVPGLLHKYAGRVLIVTTPVCAIHCRYCFRRHYPYRELPAQWRATVLEYIRQDASLHEVILSGGDPLCLNDDNLDAWFNDLAEIGHVRRIRLHTRVPVVLPERMTEKLLKILHSVRLACVMVIHANHAQELSTSVLSALHTLTDSGLCVLNQSVLLRGVNDDVDTLEALSEDLFSAKVLPYYLHQLDPVQGAAHFVVPTTSAVALVEALRIRLPGYLVPRLVWEKPGAGSKRPLPESGSLST